MSKFKATRQRLDQIWDELCAKYLPVKDGNSIWRYSRNTVQDDPAQGWKIHLSATILNAPSILNAVGPPLLAAGVQFKSACSLDHVMVLNAGLVHGYSQIGKIITVYPRTDSEAAHLAQLLHRLTYRFRTPVVPFDLRFGLKSNVYYRYGAFKHFEIESGGVSKLAVRAPTGEMVPDVREIAKPAWASDPIAPFAGTGSSNGGCDHTQSSVRVLRALVQRGKGGVYQGIDIAANPPRMCLLKEGRRHGEVCWDGRDGAARVRNEQRALARLRRCGIKVPAVYSNFEVDGNFYLVMEFIKGESLQTLLLNQRKRLTMKRALSLGIEIANFLAQMHRAGWAWRDCKPHNLVVGPGGCLIPIDFEGAERISRPDPEVWGTRAFMPVRAGWSDCGFTDDAYALGSIIYLLVTGQMFDAQRPVRLARHRRNVPPALQRIVEQLLHENPKQRATTRKAYKTLLAIRAAAEKSLAKSEAVSEARLHGPTGRSADRLAAFQT